MEKQLKVVKTRTLTLSKETLRRIDSGDLAQARGGVELLSNQICVDTGFCRSSGFCAEDYVN